jgi:hypothetical protein
VKEKNIRLMTNSLKSQSEKPETNRVKVLQKEKNDTFHDKQSEIAGRKTGDLQKPGERGKNATERKNPRPTLHARRGHAGGRSWGRSLSPTPGPCTGSSEE